jgi:hypothetical protein
MKDGLWTNWNYLLKTLKISIKMQLNQPVISLIVYGLLILQFQFLNNMQ